MCFDAGMGRSRKIATTPPEPPPVVRRGDVLFTLGAEIQEAARVAQQMAVLRDRLARYQQLHPERHAHLAAFIDGKDAP